NGLCDGYACISVSGGTPFYSYFWMTSGQTANCDTGLCAGNYNVEVTDINGCIEVKNITVNEPPLLLATGFTTPSKCGDANGEATITPYGGTSPFSYLWDDPLLQTNSTATNLLAGPYNVIVTDVNGCIITVPIAISNIPGPGISVISIPLACNGDASGIATVSTSGGTPPFIYLWDDPSAQTGSTATGLDAGIYNITVTDLYNCDTTASITVTEPDPLIVSTYGPPITICYGESTVIAASALGGNGAYTFGWDNSLPGDSSHIVSPNSTTIYTVIVTDAQNCIASASVTVNVYPPLSVSSSDATICDGNSTDLSAVASGGNGGVPQYYYLWDDGSTTSTITVSPSFTTDYTVVVSDSCSLDTSTTVTVTVNPTPVANINWACFPDSFITQFTDNSTVSSGSIVSWSWDFGDGNTSDQQHPYHEYELSGGFTVSLTVNTDKNCSNSTSSPVEAPPTAAFSLMPEETTTLNPTIAFTDSSSTAFSNVVTWIWDFGDGNSLDNFGGQAGSDTVPIGTNNDQTTGTYQDPLHTYSDTGIYIVLITVEDANGCVDTVRHVVKIISEYVLFAPNAFTPNEDPFFINEYFRPSIIGLDEDEFEIYIYNRWGNMIYEYTGRYDVWQGWDGKANKGKEIAQMDVYIWMIRIVDLNDENHEYIGHVTLIR
ncbi:MAG: PKD domain-containing protein, partial [Bacteroidota bacterium]